eukprot:22160_1
MATLYLMVFSILIIQCLSLLPYCQPSNSTCWPTQQQINTFTSTLDGSLIAKNMNDSKYLQYVHKQQNALYITYPAFIILCKSHKDVQLSVNFSASHNIQISVISTGHDYAGRNSANNSLQINLASFQSYKLNKDNLTITVESGLQWWPIFHIINETLPFDAVAIGASEGTVGPAGCTLGGCHSPQSPRYGLASDAILEYYLVDANADIIHVYNTTNNNDMITQLFWSLRGGGGSTFGVILNMTLKLYPLPKNNSKYTLFNCKYPFTTPGGNFIGNDVINGFFNWIHTEMDPFWGGYFLSQNLPYKQIIFSFNYYGDPVYAKHNIQPLMHLDPYTKSVYCEYEEYNTFYDYSMTIPIDPSDQGKSNIYLIDDLIPAKNLTAEFANNLVQFLNDTPVGIITGWQGIMIGGNVHNYSYGYTAVSEGFRSSQFVFDPFSVAETPNMVNKAVEYGQKWENKLRKFGNGMYFNEENPDCMGCDWKNEYWGYPNYNKLLNVKRYYDPNQVFWCTHCVGSDL